MSKPTVASDATITQASPEVILNTPGQNTLPPAIVYRTSGDYDDLVPITLSPDGKSVESYPAPTDVSPSWSTPLHVADGFLLDRRGISARSAFTCYTYARYCALTEAPSPRVLLDSVIPGARVTEMYALPITAAEAAADTALVNRLIMEGRTRSLMPNRERITPRMPQDND